MFLLSAVSVLCLRVNKLEGWLAYKRESIIGRMYDAALLKKIPVMFTPEYEALVYEVYRYQLFLKYRVEIAKPRTATATATDDPRR